MAMNDIVVSVSADIGPLSAGMSKGVSALATMEKQGKALQVQLQKIGEAGVAFQQKVADFAGVSQQMSKSAAASADAFKAFDTAKAKIDSMRASIDPLFAASQRYEQAVVELDGALEMGAITAQQHATMLDKLGVAYLQNDAQATKMSGGLGMLGRVSDGAKQKIQQVGFQVQDFAVQVGAGTSATQAFAQQFPQLAGAFGPVGVAIGTLAAVGVPLLVAAFGSAKKAGDGLDQQLQKLEKSISAIDAITQTYTTQGLEQLRQKYGEVDAALVTMITRQYEFAQAQAQAAAVDAVRTLAEEYDVVNMHLDALGRGAISTNYAIGQMAGRLGVSRDEARTLAQAMQDAMNAKTPAAMSAALARVDTILGKSSQSASDLRGKVQQAEAATRQLAASGPLAGWMNSAISGVNALIGRLGIAISKTGALSGKLSVIATANGGPSLPAPGTIDLNQDSSGSGSINLGDGGGGGGGGTDPLVGDLQTLQDSLKTAAQIEMDAYASRQKTLDAALAARMISQQTYLASIETMQQQHSEKMAEIDVWRYGDSMQKASAFFGGMATAMQSGNERLASMAKKFAATEALINAWRAFNQTLANPSLPWFAKIPAAMGVLSAGLGAVNAIKGGGSSGGSASAGGGSSQGGNSSGGQEQAGTMLNFSFTGGWGSTEEMGRFMVGAINQAIENGSRISGARIA